VRKCLGVLAGVALLWMLTWAQAPAQAPASDSAQTPDSATQNPAPAPGSAQAPAPNAPSAQAAAQASQEAVRIPTPGAKQPAKPQFPRIEWSGGYDFSQAGFFNAGHWAQLDGWYASFGLNGASWLGLLVEGSEVFGNTRIPTGTPAPFPNCPPFCPLTSPTFNANTREFNILFGAQFPYRKYQLWTPFGELMFGHDGVRGQAYGIDNTSYSEVSSGLALLAGGGLDRKISERFALRFKADYLQSRTVFPAIGKAKQDNLRLSVGVVIRSVKKKKRKLEDETEMEP